MARSRLITGAKVVVYVNGSVFGYAINFRWTSSTPRRAIYGIDSGEPYELAPTTTRIVGSMSLYRTIDGGGLEGPGVVANLDNIPREKYFSIALMERSSGQVIFRAEQCSVVSQSWDIPSRGIVTGSFEFEALAWNNEVEQH
ncbi:hypothetical protein EBZ38_15905 [bacterium]|nr:hypothetical protein [bacterium]